MSSAETETPADGTPADGAAEEVEEEVVEVDEAREELVAQFTAEMGEGVLEHHIVPGHAAWVRVANDAWVHAAEVAKGAMGMNYFDFLSGMDWMESPYGRSEDSSVDLALGRADAAEVDDAIVHGYAGGESRFQVFASLSNVFRHTHLFLKVDMPEMSVQSWVPTFAGAAWHEREVWEMFGMQFVGHPSLRPLYLPTDFEGHPLRKDFPLLARHVKPWPGIVDVEPMPGDDEPETAEA